MTYIYCYDNTEKFDSLFKMMEALEAIDQLSEGVVYYTTEPQVIKASDCFRIFDIEDLLKLLSDRRLLQFGEEFEARYKDGFSSKSLSKEIIRVIDSQLEGNVIKAKDKTYKSLTKAMIDEFRVKHLLD